MNCCTRMNRASCWWPTDSEEFREHLGGELTITLLRDLGVGVEVHEMDLPLVVRAIDELRRRHLARPGAILRARTP